MAQTNGSSLMVPVKVAGGPQLVEEGQASKQVVHERLRAIWLVRISTGAGAKAGQVDGVSEVDAFLRLPSVNKRQRRLAGLGVDV
jgi:hypothetical protein